MVEIIAKDLLIAKAKQARGVGELEAIPQARFAEGFDITKQVRVQAGVAEFIGSDSFASAFYERQRYEVDAGRDEEPLLYGAIYNEVIDSTLPRTININTLGPAGVVFEQITEGGEVQFATVGEGSKSVTLFHYAVGLSYTEDLFIYNELWRIPNIERQFGIAHNALMNHLHLSPVLTYTYAAANKTDGTALTTFATTASMPEKYLRTLEAAVVHSVAGKRRGPYALLVSSNDRFVVERAINPVNQQGFSLQSSAMGLVRAVVVYDGWSGTRGKKTTSYSGVSAGTGYLVDLSNRTIDFQSYAKHALRRQQQPGDLKRFIVEEVVWDTRRGVYADPASAVEEITWPVAGSGA